MDKLIKRPIVSEKISLHAEQNIYVFDTEKSATETEIKNAIERLFRVKVKSVRTAVCRDRASKGRAGAGEVRYWKKALVKLAAGEKIALFEGA